MHKTMMIAAVLAGSMGLIAEAQAHAALKTANPPVNGVVDNRLKEVRVAFSEAVIPAFSGVQITDAAGKLVAMGPPHADAKDKKVLVVPLKQTLAAGSYKLAWHAVAADTHRVEGQYGFKVKKTG
jgi:methionine-rich copper-binding protein CopC